MDCQYLAQHPTIPAKTGQKLCARHRVPLITTHGYTIATLLPWHPKWEANIVVSCNPNCIDRTQSLVRKGPFKYPVDITYCPACEAVVARWMVRPDAERRPTWWRQQSTNIHLD